MLKSLERELNNFSEQTSVLVRHSLLRSKKGNFIISKERDNTSNSGNIMLFNDEYYIHNDSELIGFEILKNELNDQRTEQTTDLVKEYSENFEIINNFDFFKDKNIVNRNVKLLGKILDCLLTHKGWESRKSNWFVDDQEREFITSIDNMGKLNMSSDKKQFFYQLEFNSDSLVYLDQKIDRKMGLINLFNLKDIVHLIKGDTLEEQQENLESYLSNGSLRFLVKFEKPGRIDGGVIKIIIAAEVPEKLTGTSAKLIKYSFNVQYNVFDMVTNQILARKKLLNAFGLRRLRFSKIGDIRREKTIWLSQGNGKVYSYQIQNPEEIILLDETLKFISKQTKKGNNLSWSTMEDIFNKVVTFYSKYENENICIPSGPDTSKFTATKSGWIKFEKMFRSGATTYTNGKYFHFGLQIGGNFTYGHPFIIMEYILLFISKYYNLPKYSNNSKTTIEFSSGTNWSAIGIG